MSNISITNKSIRFKNQDDLNDFTIRFAVICMEHAKEENCQHKFIDVLQELFKT
jgi:hypothetical protein